MDKPFLTINGSVIIGQYINGNGHIETFCAPGVECKAEGNNAPGAESKADETDTEVVADAPTSAPVSAPAPVPASALCIRIAPRKLTAVLVVLNAIFKSNWLTDAEGRPLTSRDDTLNYILQNGFGAERIPFIAQYLHPSNCPDADEKNARLLIQLLDENEMREFLHELQRELQLRS